LFVKTSRNSRKLLYDGYTNLLDREGDDKSQWRCSYSVCIGCEVINGRKKYRYKICPGRCHTSKDRDFKIITNQLNYQFLCSILLRNHFREIFYLNNEYFLIDVLNSIKMLKKIPKLKIVTTSEVQISSKR
jgi:hypothetical protein